MSIKPILFNTEMVKAILDGRKTCTRRAIKFSNGTSSHPIGKAGDSSNPLGVMYPGGIKRPPYQPGDILYVRETWHKYTKRVGNGESCHLAEFYGYKASIANSEDANEPWKPSIHMPKEATRIWLKVTDVRVERLQDITDKDAEREGAQPDDPFDYDVDKWPNLEYFKEIWNSTIKKSDLDTYGWEANPYVWVIEFERCEKPLECELYGNDKAPDDGTGKCLGYMYETRDELIPICEKCRYQASYESDEEK